MAFYLRWGATQFWVANKLIFYDTFNFTCRSKGFIWLGSRDLQFGEWSQAGAVGNLEYGGLWPGCLPEDLQPTDSESFLKDLGDPNSLLRDRRQEIVIIGSDLNKEAITKALDECLLREEESKKEEKHE